MLGPMDARRFVCSFCGTGPTRFLTSPQSPMEHAIASHERRLHTMSQDLAFVEQQLIRAMAGPQMNQSLSHTLDRLRQLRGVIAGILAKHTEVTAVWSSIAAAARSQACCMQYLQTLRAVAEANGFWPHQSDMLNTSGKEFAELFWSRDFPFQNIKQILPTTSAAANHPSRNMASLSSALGGNEFPAVQETRTASGQGSHCNTVSCLSVRRRDRMLLPWQRRRTQGAPDIDVEQTPQTESVALHNRQNAA